MIDEFYCNPRPKDTEEERDRIIKTAAKLIKSEIKNIDVSSDVYLRSAVMSDVEEALKLVPDLLKSFLKLLFAGKDIKLKLASVEQEIVQAVRPRVILMSLQLGLWVQMHHHFSSKFLIDSLNSHGFCASYKTVQKYERSAAVTQGTEIPGYTPGHFVQYSTDNVDHNLRTLDGTGTFHGMGNIAAIMPGTKATIPIPITKVSAEDIAKVRQIDICPFIGPLENTPLHYQELQSIAVQDSTANLDLLWKLTQPLLQSPRPAWNGMMQLSCKGTYPGKSSVHFLPMIDMDPTDMTCIYSTLSFISDQASRYEYTPIITFDQSILASPGMETESTATTGLGLEAFQWAPPSNSHRSPTGTPVIVGNDPL